MIFIIRKPGTQEKFKILLFPTSCFHGLLIIRKPGTQEKFKILLFPTSCFHGLLIIRKPGTQEKFKILLFPTSCFHGLLIIRKPGTQENQSSLISFYFLHSWIPNNKETRNSGNGLKIVRFISRIPYYEEQISLIQIDFG